MYAPRPDKLDPDSTARRLRALTRIRKLLRLAVDQEGAPEGRAAMARAEELMARHGLSRTAVDGAVGSVTDFRQRSIELGRTDPWRQTLMHAIADYFDCVALYRSGATEVELYGPESSLPQVEYTLVVYLRHLRSAWAAHTVELQDTAVWSQLTRRQQLDARDAFCGSFAVGVVKRLEEDRKEELRQDPTSVRQTAAQRKDLDRWMRRAGVRWRSSGSGVGSFSDEGYRAGLEAEVDAALHAGRSPRAITDQERGS